MVDLFGADKGNISLPPRLQSPEVIDGEVDDLKQVMIYNTQEAFYKVRISDISKRIQRLKFANAELEDASVSEKVLRLKKDVETADKIAQLNRQIYIELDRINDFNKRIKTVESWMAEEKQAHLDRVEAANEKYEKTRMKITSDIKALNAKINTLEEYKFAKTDLRNKLTAGNDLISKRDAEVKQRCEQIERKFKIGREKLKKEMYARLQGLAGTFQMEVAASLAKPIHRMMRENIFIKNELADIVRESAPKKEKIKRNKELDDQNAYDTAKSKQCTVENLIASKIQGHILSGVKEQHAIVKDYKDNFEQSKNEISTADANFWYTKTRADVALENVSKLETGLHKQKVELAYFDYLRNRSKNELQRCKNVFYDLKYAVASALKMINAGSDISEMGDKQLMSYLFNVVDKGAKQKWKMRSPSQATVALPDDVYRIGDLGFEASRIELRRSRIAVRRKTSRLSTLKILSSLGVRLSNISSAKSQVEPWDLDALDLVEESEALMDEKFEEIMSNRASSASLTLGSQEEEPEQKTIQSDTIEGEKSGAEKEDETDQSETEVEENMIDNEQPEQILAGSDEEIIEKNDADKSTVRFDVKQ